MRGYLLYTVIVALFTIPILIAPFLAPSNPGLFATVHAAYAPVCHQLTSRSICYFPDAGGVGDCFASGEFNTSHDSIVIRAGTGGTDGDAGVVGGDGGGSGVAGGPDTDGRIIGYKFPVCARDAGIYLFMLLGGVVFAFARGADDKNVPPAIWFVLALVPIAIDGGGQFLGFWESVNSVRLLTGAIAGFAIPFYVIPMLNGWLDKDKKSKK